MRTLLRSVLTLFLVSFGLGCASLSCLNDGATDVSLPSVPSDVPISSSSSDTKQAEITPSICRLTDRLWFDRREHRLMKPGNVRIPVCDREREYLLFSTVWQRFPADSLYHKDIRLFLGLDLPDEPLRGSRVFVRNQRYPLPDQREGDYEQSLLHRTADLSAFAAALSESGATHTRDPLRADYVISSTVTEIASDSVRSLPTIDVEACAMSIASGQNVLCLSAEGYADTVTLEEFFLGFVEELSYQHVAPRRTP